MDLERLRVFRMIARCGSLSGAARELGLSQPAVTGCVQTLERELSAQLLVRTSRGVRLTEAGRVVVELAEDLDARTGAARELIAQLAGGELGRFVLGCHPSLGSYFLPEFLPSFSARYPNIELTVRNGSSSDVLHAVRDREVDYGLVVNPSPYDELVLVPLFHDRVTFFTSQPLSPGATREDALAALSRSTLLYMERMPQASQLLAQCEPLGGQPLKRLPVGEHELARALAQRGVGVAVLPWRVATMPPQGLHMLHAELPSESDWIALCWRADRPRTHGATCLKNALVQAGRQLGGVG